MALRSTPGGSLALPISPGFLINDPAHAPFGVGFFRGITPARIAVLLVMCTSVSFHFATGPIMRGDYPMVWDAIFRAWKGCFVASVPMFLLIVKTDDWTSRWTGRRRAAAFTLAVVAGAILFTLTRWWIRALHGVLGDPETYWQFTVGYFWRALTLGGLLTAVLFFVGRARAAAKRLHRTRLECADMERQAAEARLNVLQAQIEPHFLFNSLASVKLLYAREPGEGREFLRNLIEYLRIAARHRAATSPLGDEVRLARSFLGVFQVRMGGRLRVRIDVPTDLESALMPALMLGTLVENAIKHGIGPRGEGGTLDLVARRDGEVLQVSVRDDGVGFRAQDGTGIGLANTRARLQTLFGGDGSLEIVANPEGGVNALLRLPYREAAMAEAAA